MGAIFSAAGSCLGSCCGSLACSACASCMPSKKSHSTIPFFIIFALAVIAAIVLRYTNSSVIHLFTYQWEVCDSTTCIGFGAVYRISFALTVFFLIHALCACLSFLKNVFVAFCWKFLFFLGLIVAAFAIPSPFYDDAYVNIARFASAIFLFLQIVILIDFAYVWNEKWTDDEAESPRAKKVAVLVFAACFIIASIILWVFFFIWFGGSDCPRNNFFIAWTIVCCVCFTLLAISPWLEVGGGLLPSAVLTIYSTWLLYSSLQSDPSSCNTLSSSNNTLQLILGLIFGACSMIYAAYNVATSESLFSGGDKVEAQQNEDAPDLESDPSRATGTASPTPVISAEKKDDDGELSEDALNQLRRRDIKFHFMMCAASMYVAMLLTTWGSSQQAVADEGDGDHSVTNEAYDQNVENVWIKIGTQWATILAFIWSLIAPKVCTSRDFS